jgi:polyhydroxyalkanoate synthase
MATSKNPSHSPKGRRKTTVHALPGVSAETAAAAQSGQPETVTVTPAAPAANITLEQILEAVKNNAVSRDQLLEIVQQSELSNEQLLGALKYRQVTTNATDSALGPNPFVGFRRQDLTETAGQLLKTALTQPLSTARHLVNFARAEWAVLRGHSPLQPDKEDRRFSDPTWSENPLYRRGLQTYLAARQGLESWVADNFSDHTDAERARFVLALITEALAPSNWPINPAAIKRLLETGGASAARGLQQLLDDLRYNGGMPSLTRRDAFQVGKDLANTPGAVVLRTERFELIQYTPRCEQVYQRPFLFVPPQINKFYLYDLSPTKSLIRYALDQGLQVFAISWRNPTPEQRDWGIADYVSSVEQAIDGVCAVGGSPDCNILGGCAGGITTVTLLGLLAARGERKVHSLTMLVALLDMSAETELGLFATPEALEDAKRYSARKGVLEGSEMGRVFAWMRPNDLIWNYWVNNYLLGNEPPVFDILFWNADTTRLPAAFHCDLLDIIANNALVCREVKLDDIRIDLGQIDCDIFWLAGYTDHITPWLPCYQSVRFLGGSVEFVLSSSGHIQSVLSVPGNPKNYYYTNVLHPADGEEWLQGAIRHQGSWWEHWQPWIVERSGARKVAPTALGGPSHPPLEAAPGTYVFDR